MGKNPLLNLQQVKPIGGSRKRHIPLPAVLLLLSWMFFSVAVVAGAAEYEASQVDSPPKLVRQMPVNYPPQAKRDRVEGRVVVRCLIDANGKIDKWKSLNRVPRAFLMKTR